MTRTYFITGASSGFGRLMTERLLARGDRVTATVRRAEALEDLADAYRDRLRVETLDLTDTAGIRAVVDRAFAALSPDEMVAAVRRDLRVTLGIVAEPEFAEHRPWPNGIPQYELGHLERVARAETALETFRGIFLTGNAYRGVGVNDTVRDARNTARRVLAALASGRG